MTGIGVSAAGGTAVAVLVFGVAVAAAADPGGSCCNDLEDRIAEIEATAARKGGRKVSLTVSGQVSYVLMGWADGAERNAYVQENALSQNRIGFQGIAKINSEWSAGFRLEFQPRGYRSSFANQLALGASNGIQIATYDTGSASIRHAHWILESASLGSVSVGRNFEAAFGTSTISLVSPDGFAGLNGPGSANGGFFLRRAGTTGNSGLSALTWQNFAYIRNGDGPTPMDYAHTSSHVRYTSPFLLGATKATGFQVSANWGMDDAWTAALRYAGDAGSFRIAGGAGYSGWSGIDRGMCSLGNVSPPAPGADVASNVRCHGIQTSASILHVPTGLYASGGGAQMTDRNATQALQTKTAGTGGRADGSSGAWYLQLGWQTRLNTLGNTIFWGQYAEYNTGLGVTNNAVQTVAANDVVNSLGAPAIITGTRTGIWGGGVSQEITAAAMTLYTGLHSYSTEGTLMHAALGFKQRANAIDDFKVYYTGATIRF
jgi:hypothetical protein